ncbi:MAG: 4-hydroxy-3-methylbut-2-enyl diphosphate reductase [Bacteroidales bacterium]|nr:4-hydroxy-3-methylbut-2-enyl diphosphate reductase [Bacteroidales bacterium]MCF8398530.1 4-hydroxy-3-methylbut-2-enyl diphosphate reductase [Bacteroidales bacterium]
MQKIRIEIENKAGFCPGVVKAIDLAEKELSHRDHLYCLGDIVHNPAEVERLSKMGLIVIDRDEFRRMQNEAVLLRAHGEPPETYEIAKTNKLELVDATCRIVGNLQKKIGSAYESMRRQQGQVVIFGKKDHPETIGLRGVADNQAVVISGVSDISEIDFDRPIRLFSQTTMNPGEYQKIVEACSKEAIRHDTDFDYQASVCGWMSSRAENLRMFSRRQELIIFVAGENSSNGKYLFAKVKESNPRAYKISGVSQLRQNWFRAVSSIGISGATSTPLWQMRKVKEEINKFYVSE